MLNPLARQSHTLLGRALYVARRYEEAVAAYAEVISLEPDFKLTYVERGLAYYGLGDLQSARAPHARRSRTTGGVTCASR